MICVVPNQLRESIYRIIDAELVRVPEATPDRELYFEAMLKFYDEHGELPEFTLVTPLVVDRPDFVATVAGQMAEVNEAEQREETAADLAEKRDRLHIPTTRPAAGEDAEWDKANDGDRFE